MPAGNHRFGPFSRGSGGANRARLQSTVPVGTLRAQIEESTEEQRQAEGAAWPLDRLVTNEKQD